VKLVVDAVIQVEPAIVQHRAHAAEEGRVVRDADVLDDADGGDLVVARALGEIAEVPELDPTPVLQALTRDPRRCPVGLRLRQCDAAPGRRSAGPPRC
jgi:hypothetical protein